MNKEDLQKEEYPASDRSIVVTLLFAQYRSIQTERIVQTIVMRVLWFTALLMVAVVPIAFRFQAVLLAIVLMTLFVSSFVATRRQQHLEENIRDSLVRLDPRLEDYYIKVLYEARHRSDRHLNILRFIRQGEEVIWLIAAAEVLLLRVLLERLF